MHVIGFLPPFADGRAVVPLHRFCGVCAFLNEYEAPERIMELRRLCEPGGWESERSIRGVA